MTNKLQVLDQNPVKDQNNSSKLDIKDEWSKRIRYVKSIVRPAILMAYKRLDQLS